MSNDSIVCGTYQLRYSAVQVSEIIIYGSILPN